MVPGTDGAPGPGNGVWPVVVALTVTATSSEALREPSLAVRRSTYEPAAEKLAAVSTAAALPNVTVPGPVILLQAVVIAEPVGRPSSVTVPLRAAVLGSVTDR